MADEPLKSVVALLNAIKDGPEEVPFPTSLAHKAAAKPVSSNDEAHLQAEPAESAPSDNIESAGAPELPWLSKTALKPSLSDRPDLPSPVSKFDNEEAALQHLIDHAMKHLKSKKTQTNLAHFLSPQYALALASKCMTHGLWSSAHVLLQHVHKHGNRRWHVPPEMFQLISEKLRPPMVLSEAKQTLLQEEAKTGIVSDSVMKECLEPFCKVSDVFALAALFGVLRRPTPLACNYYIKTLLASRRSQLAELVFEAMTTSSAPASLEHTHLTSSSPIALPPPNAETFEIMMEYYVRRDRLRRVESLMHLVLTKTYCQPTQTHFEHYFTILAKHNVDISLVHMMLSMMNDGIRIQNEKLVTAILWACVNTKNYGRGVLFYNFCHKLSKKDRLNKVSSSVLVPSDAFTSPSYLRALLICLTSSLASHDQSYAQEIAAITEMLNAYDRKTSSSSVASTSTTPSEAPSVGASIGTSSSNYSKEPPFPSKPRKHSILGTSPIPSSVYPGAQSLLKRMNSTMTQRIDKYLESLAVMEEIPIAEAEALFTDLQQDPSELLRLLKATIDAHRSDTALSLCEITMQSLRTSQELLSAFSWFSSLHGPFSALLLQHVLRGYYLKTTETKADPIRTHEQIQTALKVFEKHHVAMDWLCLHYYLLSLYALHQNRTALSLLESHLPTLQELTMATSKSFRAPEQLEGFVPSPFDNKFLIPSVIAKEFYQWVLTTMPAEQSTAQGYLDTLEKSSSILLSPNDLRTFLLAIQRLRRHPIDIPRYKREVKIKVRHRASDKQPPL